MPVAEATQICFYVSGSFSPADSGTDMTRGTPTAVVLTLAGLADGAGRQSDKVDLGSSREAIYDLLGCVDFTGETPTAGEVVEYYWLPSPVTTQGDGNVAGNSGADGAAPDGALGSITLDEFKKLGIYIGPLIVHDGGSVQNGYIGSFRPPTRYGQLLVINESGDAFENDNVEMHQVLEPQVLT